MKYIKKTSKLAYNIGIALEKMGRGRNRFRVRYDKTVEDFECQAIK